MSTDTTEGQRVVLALTDGTSLLLTSPFKIADEIRRLIGDVKSATPTADGKLIITTISETQTRTLLTQDTFLGRRASFVAPGRSVEGYAYAPSLSGVPDAELLTKLEDQGVIGVTRLRPTNGRQNHGIRLRFRGGTLPPTIQAGFQAIRIRPWQRSPLLCRRCAAYGHIKKNCRATRHRCLRCSEEHETDACQATRSRCPHCGGGHPAWDKKCTALSEYVSKKQGDLPNSPEHRRSGHLIDTASQTVKVTTRSTATTARPKTASTSTGTARPPVRTKEAQTDELPTFEGLVTIVEKHQHQAQEPAPTETQKQTQDTEAQQRWDRRTRQGVRAAVPPLIHDRVSKQELPPRDPELLPELQSEDNEDEHQHIFTYEDGSKPAHPVIRLYRDLARVRVVDLDLRRGTRAHKAAKSGFYSDRCNGHRLYLQD